MKHGIVILIYLLLTVGMTWPVTKNLTTHIAGSGGDPWQTLWRFEEKQRSWEEATSSNQVSSFIKNEFLGIGEPELVNLSVWPWMPLHIAFGQPTAYNIVWLLSFILSGYAMYLLVEYLAGKQSLVFGSWTLDLSLPALLAGMTYMFLPYHVAHSFGHFGAMQTQWLPLIILASIVWFKRPTLLKAAVVAVLVTMQAWTEHHYILWLGVLALVSAVLFWRTVGSALKQKSFVSHTVLLGVLVGIEVCSALLPTVRLATTADSPLELGSQQIIRFSADLFSFVTPAPFHSLWGNIFSQYVTETFTGNFSESTHYVGWIVLLLLLFFHQPIAKVQKRYWFAILVIFFIIALGPRLHVFGRILPIPLPYTLVDELPGLASVRTVARAGVVVGIAVSVLFGLLLTKQLHRKGSAFVVAGLLLTDFLFFPVPTQETRISSVYDFVKTLPGTSLIEIPSATNYTAASRALYASHIHGKQIIGNIALERADTESVLLGRKAPVVRQLLYVRTTDLREGRPEFFAQQSAETLWDAMRWLDATAVLIHRDSLSVLQTATIDRFLTDQARFQKHEFADVIVYERPLQLEGDGVFLWRDEGWRSVGYDAKREAVFADIETATLTLVNNTRSPKQVRLIVPTAPESPGGVEMTWASGTLTSGESFTLPSGQHQITLRAQGARAIIMNPELIVTP